MKEWSHLPNADHIDWVLKSLNENPELWNSAWAAARDADWVAARVAARDTACMARCEAWFAARDTACMARCEAWFAIEALIAYDDCDRFLDMSYEKLQIWAVLSEDPRAVLLLPMVYVKEKLNEQCMVTSA